MTYEQVRKRIGELLPDFELTYPQIIPTAENNDDYKIITRDTDPSLADVLMAIDIAKPDFVDYHIYLNWRSRWQDKNCVEITLALGHPRLNKSGQWNLSKPLSGQSQEMLYFIVELIK